MALTFAEKIHRVNERLKAGNVRARIQQRRSRLYLQATFPPKPGSKVERPYQQQLSLGLSATGEGLRLAEAEAKKIGGALDRGDFSWEGYTRESQPEKIGDWVWRFEADYFARRERNPKTETTWKSEYDRVFRHLPKNQPLTVGALIPVIWEKKPDSRTRKRFVDTCSRLLKFAGIDPAPLADLRGNYHYSSAVERAIPCDAEISRIRVKLLADGGDPGWVWTYGAMATWGLRNHEIFHLDLSRFPIATVLEGKTEGRTIWPFFPEWANQWELDKHLVPNCTGKTHQDLGQRVTHAFKRLAVGFPPYALRHAWAIRTIEFGLPDILAAQQMGHSVQVHNTIYHRWITDRLHDRMFRAICQNPDRPSPP